MPVPAPSDVTRGIDADPQDQGVGAGVRVDAIPVLPDPHQRILHRVLGILGHSA